MYTGLTGSRASGVPCLMFVPRIRPLADIVHYKYIFTYLLYLQCAVFGILMHKARKWLPLPCLTPSLRGMFWMNLIPQN